MADSPDSRAWPDSQPDGSVDRDYLDALPLSRVCEVLEAANREIGPRLAEGARDAPEHEAADVGRVLDALRHPPTAGDAELDQALEIIAGEPLTVSVLRRVSEEVQRSASDEDGGAAAFAQAVRASGGNRDAIAGLVDEHGRAVARLADALRERLDVAVGALVWLSETPARGEDGLSLLELVVRSLPRDVAVSQRRNPIAPSFSDVTTRDRELWLEEVGNGNTDNAARLMMVGPGVQSPLPAFETVAPTSAGPLDFYDLAATAGRLRGGGTGRLPGRAAPLPMRLFTEILLNAPVEERASRGGARYVVPLREIVSWLWPWGWRRGRDLPNLREALIALDRMAVPFQRPPPEWESLLSGPGMWRPILVEGVVLPGDGLDSRLAIRVQLPRGAAYGPQVDRVALRMAGLDSAPVYRTLLSLAYLWHERAVRGHPIRGLRGQLTEPPGRNETRRAVAQRRREAEDAGRVERNPAAERMPVLGPEDRVALAYRGITEMPPRSRRRAYKMADQALQLLERRGLVVIERCDTDGRPLSAGFGAEGWRVLPGPRWLRGALQGADDRA